MQPANRVGMLSNLLSFMLCNGNSVSSPRFDAVVNRTLGGIRAWRVA